MLLPTNMISGCLRLASSIISPELCTITDNVLFILVPITSLAHSTTVHATQETKLQLQISSGELAEDLPEFCSPQGSSTTVIQISSEDISSTVTELLTPLLSQLFHLNTPGF